MQWDVKVRSVRNLTNLNHGLWQGKLIEEVKQKQRKVYRQWQDQPGTVCPPEGEMLSAAQHRVRTALAKLIKKHKTGVIALVVPEPLASVVSSYLERSALGDLWKAERSCGSWKLIEVQPDQLLTSATSDNLIS
jgi:broad specificity phosphatase PhoE